MEDRDTARAEADKAWRAATVEERKEALEALIGAHGNASPFLVFMEAWGRAEQAHKDWGDAVAKAEQAHKDLEDAVAEAEAAKAVHHACGASEQPTETKPE